MGSVSAKNDSSTRESLRHTLMGPIRIDCDDLVIERSRSRQKFLQFLWQVLFDLVDRDLRIDAGSDAPKSFFLITCPYDDSLIFWIYHVV